jgi:regulator of protease activity HflC (stomatin/prohibitin superfamily)
MTFVFGFVFAFFGCAIGVPLTLALARFFGVYAIVEERTCRVYVLFGKVIAVLDEPGLHWLFAKLGPAALVVGWLGRCEVIDARLDQEYLRSQPINSEEGAPMGVGVWYEMYVGDPVAYLFRNMDPRGSLRANVGNAAVRCLSNMKLSRLLEDRHAMSAAVRDEVSPRANEWGYALGSVYIRKVHFRDVGMIQQIEAKVVNRLRQVTSAIRQDGTNQVNIIHSTAEREAAIEFAKALALRPQIVGAALAEISRDPAVLDAMFEVLETQRLLEGEGRLTLLPKGHSLLASVAAAAPDASRA